MKVVEEGSKNEDEGEKTQQGEKVDKVKKMKRKNTKEE